MAAGSPGGTGEVASHAARTSTSREPQLSAQHATFEVLVPASGEWSVCLQLTPIVGDQEVTPRYLCGRPVERSTPMARLEKWRRNLPTITCDHDSFGALLDQSTEDLAALRLFDPEHPDRTVVAAGAPWFMTLFGRDSLLTSWMAMMVDSDLALGTLQTLARFQGVDVNPLTEEEPGRILHEMRFGESAELSLGGGRIYYGSVDATPLFVMLLGELQRWGNRREEVDALLPAADRALAWIEDFGDRDGDGYVEYLRTSDRGLQNQGWKDSHDSTRFADGRLARPADRAVRGAGIRVRRADRSLRTSRPRRATTNYARELAARAARPEGAVQPRLLARGAAAGSRWASTATSSQSTRSRRTWATASGPASSTRTRPRSLASASCRTSMFSRVGDPHARRRR